MTDQKRENQHYTNQQMLYIHSVHGNAHQDVVEMIGNLCKQRDELREALETAKSRFHMLMIGMGKPDVDPKVGYIEIERVLTKTKESV